MKASFHTAVAIGLAFFTTLAQAQSTPAGLWRTIDDETKKEKSLIRISESGGVYTGKLEKLLDPATKSDQVCNKCPDERKDKPLVGMTLVKGVKQNENDKGLWDGGEILDPNNGKTYRVRMTPAADGKTLAVRGYIGAPLLGRTQTWVRVE